MNDKLILLFVFFGLLILFSSFRKKRKKRVVFFGDSITEAGTAPMGYISIIKNLLPPEEADKYEWIAAGVGGNKIYDLYLRADADVIAKSPDIVVLYGGINDVWHKQTHGTGTDAHKFEQFYVALVQKLLVANAKVVLCTPATIGELNNNNNPQDTDVDAYADIIRSIGADLHVPVCDLRTIFKNYIAANNEQDNASGILTLDGVHLNAAGNRLAAEAIWEKLEGILDSQR